MNAEAQNVHKATKSLSNQAEIAATETIITQRGTTQRGRELPLVWGRASSKNLITASDKRIKKGKGNKATTPDIRTRLEVTESRGRLSWTTKRQHRRRKKGATWSEPSWSMTCWVVSWKGFSPVKVGWTSGQTKEKVRRG